MKLSWREQGCCTRSNEPKANRKAIFTSVGLLSVMTLGRRKGKLRLSLLPHTKRKQMVWVFNLELKFWVRETGFAALGSPSRPRWWS